MYVVTKPFSSIHVPILCNIQVYTVNQESKYLLVQNVHALGVTKELLEIFSLYGDIEEWVD